MYHLAALEPPFVSDDMDSLLKAIKYKVQKPVQGVFSTTLKDFISKLLSKKMYERPFISEIFSLFPSSFRFTNLVDLTNYNKVMKTDEKEFKKNIVDKGLQEIDKEFIALKNRQLVQKINFTTSFKKRNKELSKNLAQAYQNPKLKRQSSLKLKENLLNPSKVSIEDKHSIRRNHSVFQNKITVHNDDDESDTLSRCSGSIANMAPIETKIKSGTF